MPDSATPAQAVSGSQKRISDLLMLTDTPWLATIIMGMAQPFAQLRETIGLPTYMPMLVALLISTLIALYWVVVEHRTRPGPSLLVVPVVAMLLFSASIGANNVVKAAATGPPASAPAAKDLETQKQLLEKELRIEREKNAILSSSVPNAPTGASSTSPNTAPGPGALLRWLAAPAYAQTGELQPSGLTHEQVQKLKELEQQRREIEATRRAVEEKDAEKRPGSLWKSF